MKANSNISVRVDRFEYAALRAEAKGLKLTMAQLLRQKCGLTRRYQGRPTKEGDRTHELS